MSSTYFLIAIALIAGAIIPTQTAVNNKMAGALSSPILAALVSFMVGTASLLIYAVVSGERLGSLGEARNAPSISWLGGILGAFFVASTIILLPRLGVVMTISLVIAGQLVMSLVIDHFGLLGMPVREISVPRVIGILLVGIGAVLIRKF